MQKLGSSKQRIIGMLEPRAACRAERLHITFMCLRLSMERMYYHRAACNP